MLEAIFEAKKVI